MGEYKGQIVLCPRYGSSEDRQIFKFDYLQRNHYNADGYMMKHFYHVILGEEEPHSTIKQAFIAEMLGFAAVKSTEEDKYLTVLDIVPDDLKYIWNEKIY